MYVCRYLHRLLEHFDPNIYQIFRGITRLSSGFLFLGDVGGGTVVQVHVVVLECWLFQPPPHCK